MAVFGKRKDGQAYPKNRKSGTKKKGSTTASGTKFKQFKKFTKALIENNQNTGIFSVDDEFEVFDDADIKKAIKDSGV